MNKTRNGFLAAAIALILLGVFGCANDIDGSVDKGGIGGGIEEEIEYIPHIGLIDMVLIPSGSFYMGAPATVSYKDTMNTPQHSVTLTRNFYMGKYEVTQAQWNAVMGDDYPSLNKTTDKLGKGDDYPIYFVNWYAAIVFCNKLSVLEGLEPVYSIFDETDLAEWGAFPSSNNALWNGAVMDINKNGYRLPTDAEWEYAARGDYQNKATETNTVPYSIGDGNSINANMANVVGYQGVKKPVGSYKDYANNYGLFDIYGNVAEWCYDHAEAFSKDGVPETDPEGKRVNANGSSMKMTRGQQNSNSAARASYRNADETFDYVGFRVVRTAPANAK